MLGGCYDMTVAKTEGTKVRKAVIAAAGFGTRFLPQTKAMPKEMLPLVDKPIIQYIVEELVKAGIEDIVIVTGYHKRSIEDHFDQISADLQLNLEQGGKADLLKETQKISDLAHFAYVRQKGPYGTATPLLNVTHLIGDEPFIYTFADDLILAEPNAFSQMIALYDEFKSPILPCITIDQDDEYERYGIVAGDEVRPGLMKASGIVEKPGVANAPSNMASIGSFLLTPETFNYLDKGFSSMPQGQEFYLSTFVLSPMIEDGKSIYACTIKDSRRYDTGNKLDYLKTVVDFALQHDDLKDQFSDYLKDKINGD
jgi:UTP--glucose-1-phosphate uridylyltransferase